MAKRLQNYSAKQPQAISTSEGETFTLEPAYSREKYLKAGGLFSMCFVIGLHYSSYELSPTVITGIGTSYFQYEKSSIILKIS